MKEYLRVFSTWKDRYHATVELRIGGKSFQDLSEAREAAELLKEYLAKSFVLVHYVKGAKADEVSFNYSHDDEDEADYVNLTVGQEDKQLALLSSIKSFAEGIGTLNVRIIADNLVIDFPS